MTEEDRAVDRERRNMQERDRRESMPEEERAVERERLTGDGHAPQLQPSQRNIGGQVITVYLPSEPVRWVLVRLTDPASISTLSPTLRKCRAGSGIPSLSWRSPVSEQAPNVSSRRERLQRF
jgi:hypothetical protein